MNHRDSRDSSYPRSTGHPGFPSAAAPLDAIRVAWEWLCARPHPVTVHGRGIAGLPDQPIPLDELRARLLTRGYPAETRDAVWAHLVRRARTDGGTWTVACAGMALPVLTRVARLLTTKYANDPTDIHAAVIAGFLTGLTRVDPDRPAVLVSLRWAAYRGGLAAVRDALRAPVAVGSSHGFESAPPPAPAGHPDLVLARAVTDKVITRDEAALIGSTRLEHVRLADAAAARGQTYHATNAARYRAERRLLAYLTTTPDTAPDTVPDPAASTGAAAPRTAAELAVAPVGQQTQARPTARRRARNARRHTRTVTNPAATPPATGTGTGDHAPNHISDTAPGAGSERNHTAHTGHHNRHHSGRRSAEHAGAHDRTGRTGHPAAATGSAEGLLRSGDFVSENAADTGVPLRGAARLGTPAAGPAGGAGGPGTAAPPTGVDHDTATNSTTPSAATDHAVTTDRATGAATVTTTHSSSAPAGQAPTRRGRRTRRRAVRATTSTRTPGIGAPGSSSRPEAEAI